MSHCIACRWVDSESPEQREGLKEAMQKDRKDRWEVNFGIDNVAELVT